MVKRFKFVVHLFERSISVLQQDERQTMIIMFIKTIERDTFGLFSGSRKNSFE
jgi:hypothetical protein